MSKIYVDARYAYSVSSISGKFNGGNNYSRRVIELLQRNIYSCSIVIISRKEYKNTIYDDFGQSVNIEYLFLDNLKELMPKSKSILFIPLVNDTLKYAKELKEFKRNNPNVLIYSTIHDCRFRELKFDRYDGILKDGLKRQAVILWVGRKAQSIMKNLATKKVVALSDKIFTVSSHSMNAINCAYHPKYINVFYIGTYKQKNLIHSFTEPYILFVSAGRPEKNFIRALKAFEKYVINHDNSTIKLIATGLNEKMIKRIKNSKIIKNDLFDRQIELKGYVDSDNMCTLYENCKFLLFVSKNEGFGLPVLEAIIHEKPMVISRCSSIPEVAGSVGVYIDPMSVESIAKGIELLMDNHYYQLKKKYVSEKKKIALEQISLDDKAFISEFTL